MSKHAEQQNKILGVMMQYLMRGTETVTLTKISNDLDFHIRSKSWVAAWKSLIHDLTLVEPATSGASMANGDHRLTEKGKKHASTPEYEQYVKDMNFVPATNEDHQERIKKRLMNDYGRKVFDLLLKHGSLDRQVMAGICNTKSGSHKYSYAVKELKDKGLVDVDPTAKGKHKMLRLTDKAFLNPDDRPEPLELDQKARDEAMAYVTNKKKRGGTSPASKGNRSKKIRSALSKEEEKEEEEDVGEPNLTL